MLLRHITRCMLAGIVAILPIGGLLLSLLWLETTFSESWLAQQEWYFRGLGLVAGCAIIYVVGFIVSSFLGRWLWKIFDGILGNIPGLGRIYETFKQILGYGEGEDAIFRRVVLLKSPYEGGAEIGLVTNQLAEARLLVFVPGSPNPTLGRLLVIREDAVEPSDMPVNAALKSLLSAGATPIPDGAAEAE